MAKAQDPRHSPTAEKRSYDTPEAILGVLHKAREALVALLAAAGVDTTQTRATARTLGLDRTFIWRLSPVLQSANLLVAARDYPEPAQVEKICAACRTVGAADADIARLRSAASELEQLIVTCAGDRESFSLMLSGLEYDDVTHRQLDARKQAFSGNSAIWGVQAKALLKTLVVFSHEGETGPLDVCRIAGMVDFRRLRNITWPLYRSVAFNDDGTPISSVVQPLDLEAQTRYGLPLLAAYSSDPLPEITRTKTSYGERFDLAAGTIGNASSTDCVFADVFPRTSQRYRDATNSYGSSMIDITTPAEVVISDIFLQKGLGFASEPEALLVDRVNAPRGYMPEMDDKHRLPLSSRPLLLGPGTGGIVTTYAPLYASMMEHVFERLGVRQRDFVGYRFLMKYPPLATAVIVRALLPERAASRCD
jgi:hypothetical protein